MTLYDKLRETIGQKFWRHIHKETLVPYLGNTTRKQVFLRNLASKIEKMQYVPLPPRAYVVSHKQNLVVRFIPTMTIADYCIYFFCIKLLEDELAKNRVPGTYGGWRLGGKIRRLENYDDAPSMPDFSYNKFAWLKAWTDYQSKAYQFYRNKNFKYFIVFDIANFYDSIRLSRLEILIREASQKNKTQIVNLLMYFLSNWGKRDLNYDRQSTGLPQDEVGDCSRILANFYLQNYDLHIYKLARSRNAGYLRYADDQIIAAPDEKTAKEIMFIASKELAKIGLNLNASKAKFFADRNEFQIYWSFDILKLLSDKNNGQDIEKAFLIFKQRIATPGLRFKEDTILKRLLNCNLNRVSQQTRSEIYSLVNEKNFLINISDFHLKKIYELTPRNKKCDFLKRLNDLSDEVFFNQYHLRVIKFAKERGVNRTYLNKIKPNLQRITDL